MTQTLSADVIQRPSVAATRASPIEKGWMAVLAPPLSPSPKWAFSVKRHHYIILALFAALCIIPPVTAHVADNGLVTKLSNHSVKETVERFERAVMAKETHGWIVVTEIDHAGAASKEGLTLA
ncbi:MAG TPA: hypothetical protein VHX39_13325, partial [Acetobacteraceae bacterium]|nr:hypothetical protein [Acetobacteraceae bacterium]